MRISEYAELTNLKDTDMYVVDTDSGTYKVKGSTLKDFIAGELEGSMNSFSQGLSSMSQSLTNTNRRVQTVENKITRLHISDESNLDMIKGSLEVYNDSDSTTLTIRSNKTASLIIDADRVDLPFSFGIDSNGNYGYIKAGADTVTPFLKSLPSNIVTSYTNQFKIEMAGGATINTAKPTYIYANLPNADRLIIKACKYAGSVTKYDLVRDTDFYVTLIPNQKDDITGVFTNFTKYQVDFMSHVNISHIQTLLMMGVYYRAIVVNDGAISLI